MPATPARSHRTCHPERARRASRRTPIVEAIDDSRLDYFRGPTPAGIAGLHARVGTGLVTGHGFSRAGCAFFLCCHHEEGFSPTRDLLLPATAHQPPTCHPERARRASRRTPIVEAISDSRPTPGWYCGPSGPRQHWPRNRARLQPCRMRLLPMLSSRGGLQPDEGSAFASHRSPAPTCHPERARRASRRTPIVEEIDDSRLDYFRGRTPTGTAGLQAGVSIGLASGHGFTVC